MNALEIPTAAGTPDAPFYQPLGNEEQLFQQARQHGMPVLIKGPTGCGKTRFVQHMAHRLNLPLYTVAVMTTSPPPTGRPPSDRCPGHWWQDGPLTARGARRRHLLPTREARRDTAVVLHPLADDRRELFIERTGEALKAPPGFMLVVSYNPGYQNLLKGMKPSTRQRFVAMRFDYPPAAEEERIVANEAQVDAVLAAQVVKLGGRCAGWSSTIWRSRVDPPADLHRAHDPLRHDAAAGLPACLAEPLSDDPQTVAALMDVVDVHFG